MLIGLTGPSRFTNNCIDMIENFFKSNFIYLNQNNASYVKEHVNNCDAVVLGGGVDIHPCIYGNPDSELSYSVLNKHSFGSFDLNRDLKEIAVIEQCFEKNIPILGICRGHQILGITHQMHLMQDISTSIVAHNATGDMHLRSHEPMHRVRIINTNDWEYPDVSKEHLIPKKIKESKDLLLVNSFHHQALVYKENENIKGVKALGIAFVGYEKQSHIVELMEGTDNNWLSCQWHPEIDWETNVFSRDLLTKFKKKMKQR